MGMACLISVCQHRVTLGRRTERGLELKSIDKKTTSFIEREQAEFLILCLLMPLSSLSLQAVRAILQW